MSMWMTPPWKNWRLFRRPTRGETRSIPVVTETDDAPFCQKHAVKRVWMFALTVMRSFAPFSWSVVTGRISRTASCRTCYPTRWSQRHLNPSRLMLVPLGSTSRRSTQTVSLGHSPHNQFWCFVYLNAFLGKACLPWVIFWVQCDLIAKDKILSIKNGWTVKHRMDTLVLTTCMKSVYLIKGNYLINSLYIKWCQSSETKPLGWGPSQPSPALNDPCSTSAT